MARSRQTADEAQHLYERLGAEIERAFTARGFTQRQLGAAIDEAQTTISDYKTAKVRVPLDAVAAIEDALDLSRGALLIESGWVDVDGAATEVAIKRDGRLDDGFRKMLLDFHRFAVERSAVVTPLPVATRPDDEPLVPDPDDPDEVELAEVLEGHPDLLQNYLRAARHFKAEAVAREVS